MIRRLLPTAAFLLALPGVAFAVDAELRKKARSHDSFERSEAARELARDGSPAAAKLLADLLADRNVYTRDHTVVACGKLADAEALAVIAGQRDHAEEDVRLNVVEALGRTGQRAVLPWLAERVRKDRSPRVRATALDGLWKFKGDAEAGALAAGFCDDEDPLVRAAAVEAVGRIRAEGALEAVSKALSDEDVGVRCVARMELRYVDADQALERLGEACASDEWRLRAQAVEDALHLRKAPAVEALLTLLGDESQRVAAAAHRALRQLSGKDFGRDAAIWKSWWEQARESWQAPEGELSADRGDDPGATRATYHGVVITSDRLVFVIDASGSMKQPAAGKDGPSRWKRASAELGQTVEALPDGTRVNVLLFQRQVIPAFPAAEELSKRTRKTVTNFMRRTSPGESGDLLAALEAALAMEEVDTVYLLSDGAPSAGRMVDKGRVRRAVRQVNRLRKVAIHCIGFGAQSKAAQAFLAGLARDSGAVVVFPGQ